MTESSPHNLDERISAYLDGELSEEEARIVQQELKDSPAARDLLRQYRDLRQMLREIPPEDLPQDLQTDLQRNVLLRVETAKPVSTPSRKPYWKVILPLLATAAGVMLLIRFNPPRQGEAIPSIELADRSSDVSEGRVHEESSKDAADETGAKPGVSNTPAPESMAKIPATPSQPEVNAPLDATGQMSILNRISTDARERPVAKDVELGVPEKLVYDKTKTSTIVSTDGTRSYEMTSEQLESLKIGDTVRALQHSGAEVSVVDLFVVDQEKALDSLQLILSSQKVPKDDVEENRGLALKLGTDVKSDGASPALEKKEKQEKLTEDQYSLVAVYVEASESQLTATLEELKREHQQFVELAIQEPLQTEELSRALEVESVDENQKDRYFLAKPTEANGVFSKNNLDGNGSFNLTEAAEKPVGFGGGGGGNQNISLVPRQQALQVSPEVLDSLSRSRRAPTVSVKAGSVLKDATAPALSAEEAPKPVTQEGVETPPTEEQLTRQMQVLFVLKQRPQQVHKARIAPPARSDSPRIK